MFYDIPRDNGFGNTRADDLCAYLGYPREKTCGRSWGKLRHKTTVFRKRFINKTPGLQMGNFPMDVNDPVARECAQSFVESNRNLFQNSTEASRRAWPIYPRDKTKILAGVVKLMCFQEYTWRRNQNYERGKQGREMTDNLRDETEVGSNDGLYRDGENCSRSSAGSYSNLRNESPAHYVTRNIRIHLEYTYPLALPPAPPIADSLFMSNLDHLDLDDIDPFAFRYIHERCLYHSRTSNEHAITQFVHDLCSHFRNDFNEKKRMQMKKMCQLFVKEIVGQWKEYSQGGFGFLHEVDGVITKSPEFEAAWRARRQEWIDTVHHGSTSSLIELYHGPYSTSIPRKRTQVAGPSLTAEAPSPKRQRMDRLHDDRPEGSTITVDPPRSANAETHASVEESRTSHYNEGDRSNNTHLGRTSKNLANSPPPTPEIATRHSSPNPPTPAMDVEFPTRPIDTPTAALQALHDIPNTAPYTAPQAAMTAVPTRQLPAEVPVPAIAKHKATEHAADPLPAATGNPPLPTPPAPNNLPVLPGHQSSANPLPSAQEHAPTFPMESASRASEPRSTVPSTTPTPRVASGENESLPSDGSYLDRPTSSKSAVAPVIEASEQLRTTLLGLKNSVTAGTTLRTGSEPRWQAINSAYDPKSMDPITPTSSNSIHSSAESSSTVESYPTSSGPIDGEDRETNKSTSSAGKEKSPAASPSQPRVDTTAANDKDTSLPSPISRSTSIDMPIKKAEHTPQPSIVPDHIDLTTVDERPNKPDQIRGSVLQSSESIHPTGTPLVRRASLNPSDSPKKPTLQFAIEDVDGIPDEDPARSVSLKELSDLSLTGLFALVALRSGNSPEELEQVTFRYQWGAWATLVVNRSAGDEAWRKMKAKMNRVFRNAREEYRKKKQFLVWVYAGDRTILKEDSGDEEDD